MDLAEVVLNIFCPTGVGGGINPRCSSKHSADTGASSSGGTGSRKTQKAFSLTEFQDRYVKTLQEIHKTASGRKTVSLHKNKAIKELTKRGYSPTDADSIVFQAWKMFDLSLQGK